MDDEALQPEQNNASYAGRWVARVHGKIIAQGGTPEQALRAAQLSRYKEKPEIIFMPSSFQLHPLIEKVKSVFPADQPIHLVGGAVRDMLLGRLSPDLDFALPSNCIPLARKVADSLKADFMILDEQRDTGRVIVKDQDGIRTFLDFGAYRGLNLEEDLRGRDFTVNALAYDLQAGAIIDPLEGAQDVRSKIIRACSSTSMSDDPVRILRAVRMAAGFGFRIEKGTREFMKRSVAGLARVSPERLRDELFKILAGPKPDASMRALEMLGVLPHFLPELVPLKGVKQSAPHVYDVWTHTLAVLGSLEDILAALQIGYSAEHTNDMRTGLLTLRLGRYREQFADHFARFLNTDRSLCSLLFFAALYHDVGKPETRIVDENDRIRFFDHEIKGAVMAEERARIFNLSNDEIDRLQKIIKNHMRVHFHASRLEGEKQAPSRKAIYRFFRDSGEAGVDLILLALADVRGTQANTITQDTWVAYLDLARILLENYWERPEEVVSPPHLVDGHDLMNELGLKPGPSLGQLLEIIRENQAAGKIENREQALSFAREEMAKGIIGES
jgi:poly(A) polymerase